LIPVINKHNPDTAKSALGRLAIESIWLPTALLPVNQVTWQELSKDCLQASWLINGEQVTLTMLIARDGRLSKASILRWGNYAEDGSYSYMPFSANFEAERNFDGYTIPAKISAGWWLDTNNYFEFFRAKIESAEFI
jgi:hypothetical protein